jgi:pimeloyl-ACP methyl ester carboxylesterase
MAARDLDRVRVALGKMVLSLLGWSYGTLLGAEYAHLYPSRVSAMVLDGRIDPTLTVHERFTEDASSFDEAFARLLDDCARRPDCAFHHEGKTREAFSDLVAAVRRKPLDTQSDEIVDGGDLGAVIVIGTTRDPATPYQESVSLAKEIGPSVLVVTREGNGDAAFMVGNECIDNVVICYFVDDTVPQAGNVRSE